MILTQLEQKIKQYLLPYNTFLKVTHNGDNIDTSSNSTVTPPTITFSWIEGAYSCADDGTKTVLKLIQINDITGFPTGVIKNNTIGDSDYVAPYENLFLCPLPVIIPDDSTPDAFHFVDQTGLELSTLRTSNSITISGINVSTVIHISGGEFQINSGSWTNIDSTVVNGDTVKVRATTSGAYNTAVNCTLTVGGVSDTFTITTKKIFFNQLLQQSFTKTGCGTGYTGSSVNYIVAANTYSSFISLADANNQALADIAANGQNYANTHGTCILTAGIFQLSSSFNTPFTGLSGTSLPSFTFPTSINTNTNALMTGTIPAQTISVSIGHPSVTVKLDLSVNGVVVDEITGISSAGTFSLVLPSSVPKTSNISIGVNI